MIDIRHLIGKVDSVPVDPSALTGDPIVDNASAFLLSIIGGGLASVDENGYVAVADGATDAVIGVFTNDGVANPLDNSPVVASGLVGVLIGGGLIVTDQVVDTNVNAGDYLYAGTTTNVGKFTKVAPAETSAIVGIARSKNSAQDKSLLVQVK